MSDLAERLREYATAEYKPAYQPPICYEAADEIDRLRAQLTKLVEAARETLRQIDSQNFDLNKDQCGPLRAVLDEIEKAP